LILLTLGRRKGEWEQEAFTRDYGSGDESHKVFILGLIWILRYPMFNKYSFCGTKSIL
jgi:hypothetical protein